jgi:transcriptional regulator with XRE-family HTH domain
MTDSDDAEVPIYAQNLRRLLEQSGLSQAEVARLAHIPRDAFGRYLHGVNRPPAAKVASLAEVFGCSHRDIDPDLPEELKLPKRSVTFDELFTVYPSKRRGYMKVRMDAELPAELVTRLVQLMSETDFENY